MFCSVAQLVVASTQLAKLEGLQDQNGSLISDASVNVTLLDSAGAEVGGVTWPIVLSAVQGVDGSYQGAIPSGAQLTVGQVYVARFHADDGGAQRTWNLNATAQAA